MFEELQLKNKIFLLKEKLLKVKNGIDKSIVTRQITSLENALESFRNKEKSASEIYKIAGSIFV